MTTFILGFLFSLIGLLALFGGEVLVLGVQGYCQAEWLGTFNFFMGCVIGWFGLELAKLVVPL